MPALKDPETKRPFSRAILISELEEAFDKRASLPLRSVRTAPVPGKPDATFLARQASEEGEELAVKELIAAPGTPSLTPPVANASKIVLDAVTGQPEVATMEGADLAACRAAATARLAAASAT